MCFVCSWCIELSLSKLQRDVDIAEGPERMEVLNVDVLPVDVVIWRVIYSFIVIERVGTTSVCHSKVPELIGNGRSRRKHCCVCFRCN